MKQAVLKRSFIALTLGATSLAMNAQMKPYEPPLPFFVPQGCSLQKESVAQVRIPHEFARPEPKEIPSRVLDRFTHINGSDGRTATGELSAEALFGTPARHYFRRASRRGAPEVMPLVQMNPPPGYELICPLAEF